MSFRRKWVLIFNLISLTLPIAASAGKLEQAKKEAQQAYDRALENAAATAIQRTWKDYQGRQDYKKMKPLLKEIKDIESQIQVEAENVLQSGDFPNKVCSVCLEDFKLGDLAVNYTGHGCKHLYHSDCIESWIRTKANATCPADREPLTAFKTVLVSSDQAKQLLARLDELNKELASKSAPKRSPLGSMEEGILRGYQFLQIPPVSNEDVSHLSRARVNTSIIRPIPAFKIANAVTSIELYHAVMGRYPDLERISGLSPEKRAEILDKWQANPDLPLTYTNLADDQVFVAELNRQTGRNFYIPNEEQAEVAIRGRREGNITTTKYHFGDSDEEVGNRAFISTNPLTQGRVHGVHEIPEGQEANYTNSYGLIHPIGNVYVRSSDGVARGGAFYSVEWFAESSSRYEGFAESRGGNVGLRLAEN